MEYDVEKISEKINKQKKKKNTIKFLVYIILLILFIMNMIGLYKNFAVHTDKSDICGLYMFNIISRKYGANNKYKRYCCSKKM